MKTITQIASTTTHPQHKLRYSINRQNISPDEKIGNCYRYGPEKEAMILGYLAEDHRHKAQESSGVHI